MDFYDGIFVGDVLNVTIYVWLFGSVYNTKSKIPAIFCRAAIIKGYCFHVAECFMSSMTR